jgi:hypothetical protein
MAEDSRSPNHTWLVVIAAFAIVSLAIGAYVYLNNKPPVAAGQVLSLDIYPIHRDLSTHGLTNGLGGEPETLDQVLVFADVRLTNQTDIPVFLQDMWATFDLPDGAQRSGAASQNEIKKAFLAYPQTARFRKQPIPRDLTLQPGQSFEGLMVFHYAISKAQWDQRTNLQIHVSMLHQNSLVIDVPKTAGS